MLEVEVLAVGLACFSGADNDGLTTRSRLERTELDRNSPYFRGNSPIYRIVFLSDELPEYSRRLERMCQLSERPNYETLVEQREIRTEKNMRRVGLITVSMQTAADYGAEYVVKAGAQSQLVHMATAAVAFHAKHNRYPNSVGELTPEFLPEPLLDPFDGKPLRLRPDGEGLILYSVNRDHVDNPTPEQLAKPSFWGPLMLRLQ